MHHWQDLVLTIGALFFIAGLMPSIFSNQKPATTTSLTNGLVLSTFSITYVTLSLWFTAVVTAATAVCWFVLAVQTHRRRKQQRK